MAGIALATLIHLIQKKHVMFSSRFMLVALLALLAVLPLRATAEQPTSVAAMPSSTSSAALDKDKDGHAKLVANFKKGINQIISAANHPFLSFKETRISILSIIKFAVLLALALLLLQKARTTSEVVLQRKTRMSAGSASSIATLGYYVAAILVFLVILSTIGINLTQLTVVFGALGIGIGFGLQAIMNNFISGVILLAEQVIKIGDIVSLESGVTGEVKKIAIRATVLRTGDGEDVIVPNSEFVSGRVKSWTYNDDWRRLKVPFGVAYHSDPDEVVRLATEAAREVDSTREDKNHPIQIFFEGYGASSLDFSIRVWCRMHQLRPFSALHSDYYFVLFRKLMEAGIELPYPQRDLHLRSVVPAVEKFFGSGSKTLNE